MASPLILFSTNTYLKFSLQERHRGEHHVWCSPTFAAEKLDKYALGAGTPPSSDPATIYRDLREAVLKTDEHCGKIVDQRKTLTALAIEWCKAGHITDTVRDDIVTSVEKAPFNYWRPLVYAIPYGGVAGRVKEVPRKDRASIEPEYIIPDLKRAEFEIIEL